MEEKGKIKVVPDRVIQAGTQEEPLDRRVVDGGEGPGEEGGERVGHPGKEVEIGEGDLLDGEGEVVEFGKAEIVVIDAGIEELELQHQGVAEGVVGAYGEHDIPVAESGILGLKKGQLTREAGPFDIARPAGAGDDVLAVKDPAKDLQVVHAGVETDDACGGDIVVVIHLDTGFDVRRGAGVVMQAQGVAARFFRVVDIEERIGVEDVIGVPHEGLAPVDALAAGPHLEVPCLVIHPNAVDGRFEDVGGAAGQGEGHVHPALIGRVHLLVSGDLHGTPEEKAVAYLQVGGEMIVGIPFQLQPVVDEVVQVPGVVDMLEHDALHVVQVPLEEEVAAAAVLPGYRDKEEEQQEMKYDMFFQRAHRHTLSSLVRQHLPVFEGDDTPGFFYHTGIVGGKDEGDLLLPVQLFHDVEQVLGGVGVEVGGGFVGQDEFGLGGQGAGHGDALLLSSRELAGAAVEAVAQAHGLQQLYGPFRAFGFGPALQVHDKLHVLQGREHRQQVVGLKDKTDVMQPEVNDLTGFQRPQIGAVDDHRAGGGPVQTAQEVQESGLPRAGRSYHGGELAFFKSEVDVIHGRDLYLGAVVDLHEVFDLNDVHIFDLFEFLLRLIIILCVRLRPDRSEWLSRPGRWLR